MKNSGRPEVAFGRSTTPCTPSKLLVASFVAVTGAVEPVVIRLTRSAVDQFTIRTGTPDAVMSDGLRYSNETIELSDHCSEMPEKHSPELRLVGVVEQP